jgi:hypothetical protein
MDSTSSAVVVSTENNDICINDEAIAAAYNDGLLYKDNKIIYVNSDEASDVSVVAVEDTAPVRKRRTRCGVEAKEIITEVSLLLCGV